MSKSKTVNKTESVVAVGCDALLGDFEPGRALHKTMTGCDDLWNAKEDNEPWINSERDVIEAFIAEVNRRAENNMLKTGKLEGAHHAAMKQVLALYSPNY